MLRIINFMERMSPQHKSSCCSRGPLAHILRNKHSKQQRNFQIFDFIQCMGPQHKPGCSRGPLAYNLQSTANKILTIITAFELNVHSNITNFPERMDPFNKVESF